MTVYILGFDLGYDGLQIVGATSSKEAADYWREAIPDGVIDEYELDEPVVFDLVPSFRGYKGKIAKVNEIICRARLGETVNK